MRARLTAALFGMIVLLGSATAQAAPDPATALLVAADIPAGWVEQPNWDWQRTPIPDGAGGLTSLGMATAAGPQPSPTQLGGTAAGVSFALDEEGGWEYRGVQHAVIIVPKGQGAAKFAVLRAAMRTGTARIPEREGPVNVQEFTALAAPAVGQESAALRVTVWDEVAGREPDGKAQGVYYAFRRGDAIALLIHIEAAAPARPLDTSLTARLAQVADQRLAALAGVPLTDGGEKSWLPQTLGALALVAVAAAGAALLVARRRHRPHTPRPA